MSGTNFFTFYSFKGGVGRSMSLLNCAYLLAASGRRVLMIDMDLEAPGLTYLVRDLKSLKDKPYQGLLELIAGFLDDPRHWPLGNRRRSESLRDYLVDLAVPESLRVEGVSGRLSLLPAGQLKDAYAERLGRFGDATFKELREQWAAHLRGVIETLGWFDYVLIDARTGYSDEGYLAVRVMADHLVVLSGLNDQNLLGTARFLRQFQTWNMEDGRKERRVLLVASPVPEWEDDAKQKRREEAKDIFQQQLGTSLAFSHELPYHPQLALQELAIVDCLPDSRLAGAYRSLTTMLRGIVSDSADDWANHVLTSMRLLSSRADAEPANDLQLDRLRKALNELRPLSPFFFKQIVEASVNVVENLPQRKKIGEFLDWLDAVQPGAATVARIRWLKGRDIKDAVRILEDFIKLSEEKNNSKDRIAHLQLCASLAEEIDEPELSHKILHQLLQHEEIKNDPKEFAKVNLRIAGVDRVMGYLMSAKYRVGIAMRVNLDDDSRIFAGSLIVLAMVDFLQGNYRDARQGFEEVLSVSEKNDYSDNDVLAIHGLGVVAQAQGSYSGAKKFFERALNASREFDDQERVAYTLRSLGTLERIQGKYDVALENYKEALKVSRKLDRKGYILIAEIFVEAAQCLICPSRDVDDLGLLVKKTEAHPVVLIKVVGWLVLIECYFFRKDFVNSIEIAAQAIEVTQQLGMKGYEADGRAWHAVALDGLGQSDEARIEARRALTFFREAGVKAHPLLEQLQRLEREIHSDQPL